MADRTLMQQYLSRWLIDYDGILYHDTCDPVRAQDFYIRAFIGKTDDIEKLRVGMCSHQAILERERDAQGLDPEKHCRVCGINLDCEFLQCNDFLVLRNPLCRGPICGDCIRVGGDVFYKAYRRGLEAYHAFKEVQRNLEDVIDRLDELIGGDKPTAGHPKGL